MIETYLSLSLADKAIVLATVVIVLVIIIAYVNIKINTLLDKLSNINIIHPCKSEATVIENRQLKEKIEETLDRIEQIEKTQIKNDYTNIEIKNLISDIKSYLAELNRIMK